MARTMTRASIAVDAGQPAIYTVPAMGPYYVARATDGRLYMFSSGRAGAWETRSPYMGGYTLIPLNPMAAAEASRIAMWGLGV